jgi:excisionase family DNA binding protein
MSTRQTAAINAADTPARHRRAGSRARPPQQTVRSAAVGAEHPLIATTRTIVREELINMHPDVRAQLIEQLRDAMPETGRKDIFNKAEAADYTRHSVSKIERLIASKELTPTYFGDSPNVLLRRADLDALLVRGAR